MALLGRFTTREGQVIEVDSADPLTLYKRGDTRLDIDNLQGVHIVYFGSRGERDRALRAIQGDHYVWEDDVQVNRQAPNYGKHFDDLKPR